MTLLDAPGTAFTYLPSSLQMTPSDGAVQYFVTSCPWLVPSATTLTGCSALQRSSAEKSLCISDIHLLLLLTDLTIHLHTSVRGTATRLGTLATRPETLTSDIFRNVISTSPLTSLSLVNMNAPRRRPQLSISARLSPWAHKTRQMTAPVLAALLSFIFVAVHPLADLAGE